eukprot:14116547-Alexandrium_andersonii.AAC.1
MSRRHRRIQRTEQRRTADEALRGGNVEVVPWSSQSELRTPEATLPVRQLKAPSCWHLASALADVVV